MRRMRKIGTMHGIGTRRPVAIPTVLRPQEITRHLRGDSILNDDSTITTPAIPSCSRPGTGCRPSCTWLWSGT